MKIIVVNQHCSIHIEASFYEIVVCELQTCVDSVLQSPVLPEPVRNIQNTFKCVHTTHWKLC